MTNARTLWAKLPKFMRTHQTVRAELLSYQSYSDQKNQMKYEDRPVTEANLITSLDTKGWGAEHRPVLDIDFNAAILPSSTEGHCHLFIDKLMPQEDYFKLIDVMAEVGLLQPGFVNGSKRRGATSVRLPWISKDREPDNAFDPTEYDLTLDQHIADAEAKLKELKSIKAGSLAANVSPW